MPEIQFADRVVPRVDDRLSVRRPVVEDLHRLVADERLEARLSDAGAHVQIEPGA